MQKYAWSFYEDAEVWQNSGNTIEECIADAIGEADIDEKQQHVFIAEVIPFTPAADGESVLEQIQETAYDTCGEPGGDWCAYDCAKHSELEALSQSLTDAVNAWLKQYGYYPNFGSIGKIKRYELKTGTPA